MLLARIIGAEWLRRRVTSSRLRHHYLSPSERSEQRHMADFARHLAVAGNQKSMTYANREGGRGGRGKTGSLVGLFVRRRRAAAVSGNTCIIVIGKQNNGPRVPLTTNSHRQTGRPRHHHHHALTHPSGRPPARQRGSGSVLRLHCYICFLFRY